MLACTKGHGLPYRYAKCRLKTSENSFSWHSKRVSDGVTLEGECRHIGEKTWAEPNTLDFSFRKILAIH